MLAVEGGTELDILDSRTGLRRSSEAGLTVRTGIPAPANVHSALSALFLSCLSVRRRIPISPSLWWSLAWIISSSSLRMASWSWTTGLFFLSSGDSVLAPDLLASSALPSSVLTSTSTGTALRSLPISTWKLSGVYNLGIPKKSFHVFNFKSSLSD